MTDGIHLTFVSGDQHGSSVQIHRLQTVVFGSSVAADVQVNDPSVEPLHFEIRGEAGRFRLVDLGTPRGTQVNQKRVAACALMGGERIRAGDMEWDVVRDLLSYDTDTSRPSPRSDNRGEDVEDSRVPSHQASSIAQILDAAGYLLHEELGRGAYGAVYRATRQSDKCEVAIKVFENVAHANDASRQLFAREIKAIEELRSPHVVQLVDAGQILDNIAWYAMELVRGSNLKRWVMGHSELSFTAAARMMRPILSALEAAHELPPPAGPLVHRDVKPANVLVTESASKLLLKLADFGTAKTFEDAGHSALTRTGDVRGTLLFMSREQLTDSRYIGPEGDIFAAGAVFYFLLTRSAMYSLTPQSTPSELVNLVMQQAIVPLSTRRPDTPQAVDSIFRRAVALDTKRQFRSARQFRLEIEHWLQDASVEPD